ncbi:methylaspartate mutase [Micromonospora siamensis]|uniref:Glutamate mutase subunit E n=1 Tax=Micromonospora siamensis TaxID=299152 RepID=A0A1C5J9L1_9ACTN|nr:methylaspartate mutase [Micromonospora siamensis]SCG66706.1 Glutamate mutase subunit E [Micromonospora siamensis]
MKPAGAGTRPQRPDGAASPFGEHVARMAAQQRLIVQPRMGMGDPVDMQAGLMAVKAAEASTIGTITLDSYTRCNDDAGVRRAMAGDGELNGYPIVAHSSSVTSAMVDSVRDPSFVVQVRHGSAAPQRIFEAIAMAGLDATEGGPISYCLPYSRLPLAESVVNWATCCETFGRLREEGYEPHLETFGGCMLGQLCPPSLLVAISVLEALFFRQHGLRSISLSYAQQTNATQDLEAIAVLSTLAAELLPDVDWHVVLYAYMGVYPSTVSGTARLLDDAARLAVRSGAARLIVKTAVEAYRIPTISENVTALEHAAAAAQRERSVGQPEPPTDTGILAEARTLIEAVLDLGNDLDRTLSVAVERGLLDVPYCLHPDNLGRTRTVLDRDGRLYWSDTGALPLPRPTASASGRTGSADFRRALNYVARKYDSAPPSRTYRRVRPAPNSAASTPAGRRGSAS